MAALAGCLLRNVQDSYTMPMRSVVYADATDNIGKHNVDIRLNLTKWQA